MRAEIKAAWSEGRPTRFFHALLSNSPYWAGPKKPVRDSHRSRQRGHASDRRRKRNSQDDLQGRQAEPRELPPTCLQHVPSQSNRVAKESWSRTLHVPPETASLPSVWLQKRDRLALTLSNVCRDNNHSISSNKYPRIFLIDDFSS